MKFQNLVYIIKSELDSFNAYLTQNRHVLKFSGLIAFSKLVS